MTGTLHKLWCWICGDLTDDEFMRRLRAHFIARAGDGADAVVDCVDVETWRQSPFENDPEEAAEEEMSYWTNDGE